MSRRSRSTLHKSKLKAFQAWLEGEGWTLDKKPNADWQVLRMTHPHHVQMLIVYDSGKERREHLTCFGESERMARRFVRSTETSPQSRPSADGESSNSSATL